MAKPVAGALGYNSDLDRPTVQLRSGVKRLLTEDDSGGGGSVDSVTSGSAAIDVDNTDTANPVVSLDESELENGGAQEISVSGLSGVLADAQVADKIKTSGTAVTIDNTPPSAGQVLTASSATAASWVAPTATIGNPYLAPPTTAHADNDEFNSGSDDLATRGYTVWDASNSVVLTRSGDIDPFTTPSPGGYWSRLAGSYLLLQVPSNTVVYVYKAVSTMNSVTGIYWTRIMGQFNTTKSLNLQPSVGFNIWQSSSSRPDGSNKVEMYRDQDSTTSGANPRMVFSTRLAGTPTNVIMSAATTELGLSGFNIMGFRFSSTNTYQHFAVDDGGDIFAGAPINSNAPNKANIAYVGWAMFQNGSAVHGLGGLIAIDFLRRVDGASNVWIAQP